jgi:hypothetical protein
MDDYAQETPLPPLESVHAEALISIFQNQQTFPASTYRCCVRAQLTQKLYRINRLESRMSRMVCLLKSLSIHSVFTLNTVS